MPGRNYPLLFAKGMAMGAADVVPGVSGGTIAFISGIYSELVDSLKAINPNVLSVFVRHGPIAAWRAINGSFLTVLFSGVLVSVFSLARVVKFLLENQPVLIWSFFFGLIVASIIYVMKQQRHWGLLQILGLVTGALLAAASAFSPPLAIEVTPLSLFCSGMIAICAMILPGVSGSFLLLLMGVYPAVIEAITELNLVLLGAFGLGAAVGLMAFSHVLSWLLHHHRATTLSVLVGFLVGSLTAVWPWKETLPDRGGHLMLPSTYAVEVGHAQVGPAIALMVLGLGLVLILEYLGFRYGQKRGRQL
jgi:putative membrane protein